MQSDELTLAGGHVEDGREIVILVRWAVALGSRLFLLLVQSQVEKARNPGRRCLRDVQLHHTRHSYVSYSCRTAVCVVQCASAAGKLIHAHAYPSLPSSAHFYGISQKIPNHAEDRALNLHFSSPNPPSRKQKSAADHTHDAEVLTSHSSM